MTDNTVGLVGDVPAYSALQFDPEEYLAFVEAGDLTDAQAREFLEALWNIMVAFVDLGFGLTPRGGPVGQIVRAAIALEVDSGTLLESGRQYRDNENDKTARSSTKKIATGPEDS
jgi:hypothetical protein